MASESLVALRLRLATAIIVHASDLGTDRESLGADLGCSRSLREDGPSARHQAVSGLFAADAKLAEDLRRLAENLADVLALIAAYDDPRDWLRKQLVAIRGAQGGMIDTRRATDVPNAVHPRR